MRKHPAAQCESCPLQKSPFAASARPKKPRAAIVARSPGYHEAKVGVPFSGPAGKVLNFLLSENGIKREEVLLTNVVLCSPNEGKVPPQAIRCCRPRLEQELQEVNLIVAAGVEAVNSLIGRGSVDRYRGYRIQKDRKVYIATNNPALVLRDDSTFPNLRKDFRRAFNPPPALPFPKVRVLEEPAECARYLKDQLDNPGLIAVDTEARGGLKYWARILSIQFSRDPSEAVVIGERRGVWQNLEFLSLLKQLLESPKHRFVWHNGKFDCKLLRRHLGIHAVIHEDTLLMSYACDERSGATAKEMGGIHKLETLLAEEFGWPDYEPESVKRFKKTGSVTNYQELYTYAGRDVGGTLGLYYVLSQRVKDEGVEQAYRRLLLEGAEACLQIELQGFRFDVDAAADLMEEKVRPELELLEKNLREISGVPTLNPSSPVQIANLLYDEWGVRHKMQNRPDKQRSTDEAALQEISRGKYPARVKRFVTELRRYRELSKQANTYIVGMIGRAIQHPEHRIYTDLLLHGTTTGRLSSRNPNLQNITRSKPELPNIRDLFLASPGRKIIQADYSQAELRCIAYLSQDPELLRIYSNDLDLHSVVAERFYGKGFSAEQRSRAKNMNFGVAYGQSAATFQEKHDIPETEAQKFIDWWWTYFSGVKKWKDDIIAEMRTGRVVSPFGRVRRFYLLTKENFNTSVREAVNFKPQSTAGDLTLRSVILALREIDPKRAAIVITVHDSIVADVDEDYTEEYTELIREIMESRPKEELGWTIPFTVDIGIGDTWGKAK